MRLFRSRGGTLAALVLGGALMCLSVTRAAAQFGLFDAADWMVESDLLTTGAGDIDVSTPLENRYLTLWAYEGTDEDSKFSLWTNIGDPLNPGDDQFFVVDRTVAPPAAAAPWGSRVFCSDRGEAAQDRPYGNIVTVRMDDPANPGAFLDQVFPDDGAAQFAPPRVLLPLSQGYFSPYLFDSGNIKITQKLTLIRDLLRVEYEIVNQGGTARRVGIRLLQNPYFDNLSVFVPSTRQRIFKEVDFGIATGTGANPPRRPDFPTIPPEMQVFSQDDALNPAFNVKCVFTGPGITSPTRVAIVDALKVYPTDGQWDYSVAFGQELRISDIGFLIYWDPVLVPAGQRRSFVNYVGMAAATQAVSNAFLLGQNLADNNETQGYVAAVQTPEATPLVNGNADVQVAADPAGTPIPITVDAYMHSLYHRAGISSAFAFLDIPDGLQFITTAPDQSLRQDIGALEPVSAFGGGVDERQVQWTLQANGIEAGLLNVNVSFNNSFDDATRVSRRINVPQGTRYQLGPGRNWRFLTMPFRYIANQNDPAVALGLAPGTFQIVRYNPATNQYQQVDRLEPGRSYWIRSLNLAEGANLFFRLQAAQPVDLQLRETALVPLVSGWNMVGNPIPYALSVGEVRFVGPGGVLLPFDQAVATGLIRPGIFQFNRRTRVYEQLNRESVIQPGRGIWIFSTGERIAVFPGPFGLGVSITP